MSVNCRGNSELCKVIPFPSEPASSELQQAVRTFRLCQGRLAAAHEMVRRLEGAGAKYSCSELLIEINKLDEICAELLRQIEAFKVVHPDIQEAFPRRERL